MGFIIKEDNVLVHCKLTDEGRRKISQGKFNPSKFSIGDSEVNYEYYKNNNHNIVDTYIKSPIDRYKSIKNIIKANPDDNEDKYDLIIKPVEEKKYIRQVGDKGFYNGDTYEHILKKDNQFLYTGNIKIDISNVELHTLSITKTDDYDSFTREPELGNYIIIKWTNPYFQDNDEYVDGIINPDQINPYIWYKIIGIEGLLSENTLQITVDRELPNFGGNIPENEYFSYGYIYPSYNSMKYFFNSQYISDYWETSVLNFKKTDNNPPLDSQIWNLNILHIDDIAGSGYINFNKINQRNNKYAGLITYLKEDQYNIKNIGIIHFTNNNPSNIYGEKFEEDIVINIPTLLWHKNEDEKIGIRLKSDNILKILPEHVLEYYDLIDDWGNVVGKIFIDLKIIIIDDQEILFALSYKSNRNWTLMEPTANIVTKSCEEDSENTGTIYYGTYEVLGSIVNIPTPQDIDILTGTSVDNVGLTGFSLDIPFNSDNNDFIWLAIPDIFPLRTKWYVNIFNKGDISGIKNLNGNLFPDVETVMVNGINYSIYISNYRTKAETINFLLE